MAVFYEYLWRHTRRAVHLDLRDEALEVALDRLGDCPGGDLQSGFTGIVWAESHIRGQPSELAGDVEFALRELMRGGVLPVDALGGLSGCGVFALETGRLEFARAVAEAVAESAYSEGSYAYWPQRPEQLPADARSLFPTGYVNCGTAHGTPGIIAFLSRVRAATKTATLDRVIQGAIRWLIEHELPSGSLSNLPPIVRREQCPTQSRLAWCYGDLGAAAVLQPVENDVPVRDFPCFVEQLAVTAADMPTSRSGVIDHGMCHGALGVVHQFNRLHERSGDGRFLDAAIRWFDIALQMRRPKAGRSGFFGKDSDRARDAPGLVAGLSGMGLALLAAIDAEEPQWDRVFFLS
ncbi:MAG: hypothetical protein KC591_14820 [Gemmatimonadetes bacterium]|nr:hypothetical protein [Gemmatimonadota bacterium]